MMQEKKCFKCGRTLPLSEFYTHSQMGDGHLNKCRDCTRADAKRHRHENPQAIFETRMRSFEKKPTHDRARKVFEAALAAGVLVNPGVCYGCGCTSDERRIEGHHHDYRRPLDVVWVCTPCHRRLDQMRILHESGVDFDEWEHERRKTIRRAKYAMEKVKKRSAELVRFEDAWL